MAEPLFDPVALSQFVWVVVSAGVITVGTVGVIAAFVYRGDR